MHTMRAALPSQQAQHRVLAFGAHLKNRIGLWHGQGLQLSALHGDLDQVDACTALRASAQALLEAHGPVQLLAHDLHPNFYSTHCALEWAQALDRPALGVQHHHAHIAGVAAFHGLRGPVLGWALDGYGMGPAGEAWGGELLWVDGAQWRPLTRLHTLALPGGDKAARQPWRLALAFCHATGITQPASLLRISSAQQQAIRSMLDKGLNCPPSSSAGRWFDAVAALLGVCLVQDDEAQAPLALQALAEQALAAQPERADGLHDAWLQAASPTPGLPMSELVRQVLALAEQTGVAQAALHFHRGLADGLATALQAHAQHLPLEERRVCLSGGCFYNPLLRERLRQRLEAAGWQVFVLPDGHGDAHLPWGQAWIAREWLARHPQKAHGFCADRCDPLTERPEPALQPEEMH